MRLFSVHGLDVQATERQTAEYSADPTQYDVIKDSLEKISKKVQPTCQGSEFIHAFRLNESADGKSRFLLAVTGKNDTQFPTFMLYEPKTQTISREVSVENLTCLRNSDYVSLASERLAKAMPTAIRALPENCETIAYQMMVQPSEEVSLC